MPLEPVSSLKALDTINFQELTAFQHLTSFNLLLYSRSGSNLPLFLLYKGNNSLAYTHCSGTFTKHDPNIYFSVIREFISQNRGLLYTPNLAYFKAKSAEPSAVEKIVLEEELNGPVRAQKGFTAPVDDAFRVLSECQHIFQDDTGCVTYFVELPLLSLEALNDVAQKKGLEFSMEYYTFEELLDSQNKEICQKLKLCLDNPKLQTYAQRFIVEAEPIEIKERYAMISCEPKVETYMMHALHYPIYKKHGEHWKFYKAFKGELPTDEEIKSFKGIIIPGSSCSAYADHPWYKELFDVISKIVDKNPQINVLGICFGAQVTAQALGGRVEKMNRPFIRGGEFLNMDSKFYQLDYIQKSGVDPTLNFHIAQSHGDHIVELPPKAVHHGTSASTNMEVYTIGHNVLAFQGHPENNEAWTAGANYRVNKMQIDDYDRYADAYIKEKFSKPITRFDLTKICFTFLKKNNEGAAN